MQFFPIAILLIADSSDMEFMQRLYIEYSGMMFKMARSLCASDMDAEDIVSDACVALICKISDLREFERNVLEGYVISIVKNAAYMRWRKRKRQREVELNDDCAQAPPEGDPLSASIYNCSIEQLTARLKTLPEIDQAIVRLKYFEDMTNKQIADELGIKEVTLRSRLFRIRAKLYKQLSEDEDE